MQIGDLIRRCRARLASDEEIARYWPRLLELWPALESYRRRSGVRYILVLEPIAEATAEPWGA